MQNIIDTKNLRVDFMIGDGTHNIFDNEGKLIEVCPRLDIIVTLQMNGQIVQTLIDNVFITYYNGEYTLEDWIPVQSFEIYLYNFKYRDICEDGDIFRGNISKNIIKYLNSEEIVDTLNKIIKRTLEEDKYECGECKGKNKY